MADTTFVSKVTTIATGWMQDLNDFYYRFTGKTGKTTPVDGDGFYLWDSIASAWKSLTWANLKATMLAYLKTDTGIWNLNTHGNADTATLATAAGTLNNTAPVKIPGISVTPAVGNTLNVSLAAAVYLDFRNSTLTAGDVTTLLCNPTALVVSSGATLGTTNGVAARLIIAVINNAGTPELAIANISGLSVNEGGVISTTIMSAASDSAAVWYSTTARSNVAFRVVGYVDITEATAGTWVSAPTVQHGMSRPMSSYDLQGSPTFFAPITASLGADVAMISTVTYYDGPSVAQGSIGTWFVTGTVTVKDTGGGANFQARLWDGTTVIASAYETSGGATQPRTITLSGYIKNPAGNLRISVKDSSSGGGVIIFNVTGDSKDSTITAIRVG